MQTYSTEPLRHLVQNSRVHRDFYTSPEVFKIELERIFGRTCHFLSNIVIDGDHHGTGEILVQSNLMMLEYRLDKQTTNGAHCRHLLRLKPDGAFEIAWKRVDLINCDGTLQMLSVPL